MGLFKRNRLRVNTTKPQSNERSMADVRVELNVAPPWWAQIHHHKGGAFAVTLHVLSKKLDELNVEPLAIRAEGDRLTVVVAADRNRTLAFYEALKLEIHAHLVADITLEDSDYLTQKRPDPPKADGVATRSDVEKLLRDRGYVRSSELDHKHGKVDDFDIWSLPQTASQCVQFDERAKPDEIGFARWMDADGEEKLSFDQVMVRLEEMQPVKPLGDGGVLGTGKTL